MAIHNGTFRIPGVSIEPSRIGLGGAPTGGHGWGERDDKSALSAIVSALDCGITLFDTADVYGLGVSEILLARALKQVSDARERVVIVTKGGVAWDEQGRTRRDSSPKHIAAAAEDSLKRLGTDCLDLYLLHWPDGNTPIEESAEALARLRQQGKARAIGLSNVTPDEIYRAREANIAAIQTKGNLLEPADLFEVSAAAKAIGATVICSSVLADGLLTGSITISSKFSENDHRFRYPLFQPEIFESTLAHVQHLINASKRMNCAPGTIALRWPIETGAADAVLFGTVRATHVKQNSAAIHWKIPSKEMIRLAMEVPVEDGKLFQAWRQSAASRLARP